MQLTFAMQFTITGSTLTREDARAMTELARMADDFGLHSIGLPDSSFRLGEAASRVTLLALGTTRAFVGMRPTNPWNRDPQIAAAFLTTIGSLTAGHAFMEVTTGDTAVRSVGRQPATRLRLAEYIRCVRDLLATGTGHYDGREIRAFGGPWPPARLSVGAEGPRMLELAGQVGDAVSIGTGLTPDVVADSLGRVRRGAVAAGRDPGDVEPWFTVRSVLRENGDAARAALLPSLASILHHSMRAGVTGRMVPERYHQAVAEFAAGYDLGQHQVRGGKNEQLLRQCGLAGFAYRRWGLAGGAAEWADRLDELSAAGVRRVWLSNLGPLPEVTRSLRDFGERVLPRLG